MSYKNKVNADSTIEYEWHTPHLPTGAYDIEDINEEIINEIERITEKNKIVIKDEPDKYPIEIHGHEPLLSTTIEINSPDYAVDLYGSSIRTLLGWPEYPPGTIDIEDLPRDTDHILINRSS